MTGALIVVVIALIAVGLAGALIAYLRQNRAPSAVGSDDVVVARPRPAVSDFHVRGEEARVFFDVPLPVSGADQVLSDLLVNEAVEVVREKRHELPISQVTTVVAFGTRGGEAAEAGRMGLLTPGELPPPVMPEMHPHASKVDFDPIAASFEGDLGVHEAPRLAERGPERQLGPAGSEVRLVGSAEAALRAQGVDPAAASAGQLVLGLLQGTGYVVTPGPKPGTHYAERAGTRTFIRVVDHEPGGYPELSEKEVDGFVFDFVSAGADRGLLVTDKYAPFAVYDKERREKRIRYVSRERLQRFLDALSL